MHISTVLELIKETRYMGSMLKEYSDSLSPGKYCLFNSFRAMSLKAPQTRKTAEKYFQLQHPYRARAKTAQLLNKISYFCNRNKRSSGEYEAFYVANNYDAVREIKLFSFHTKRVLSICTDHEKMLKQLSQYEMLKHAYRMPDVTKSDKYETALEVAMVDRLPTPGESAALTAIARATAAYNPEPAKLSYRPVRELIEFSYSDESMNVLLQGLADSVDKELLRCALPVCMQHGDLSKDNLIHGESNGCVDYWWIDWEHAGERIFFYDYFFYILNPGIYGDLEAFSCYMSGQNDDTLKDFFSHFGLTFDPGKRRDYFIIYAICFLKERVCDLGNVIALEQYCEFFNKHCPNSANDGGVL